jgi:hypothetical protein
MPDNIHYFDELIHGDSCTTGGLCCALSTSKCSVMAITEEPGYSKVCAWWLPQMLTYKHKQARKATIANF